MSRTATHRLPNKRSTTAGGRREWCWNGAFQPRISRKVAVDIDLNDDDNGCDSDDGMWEHPSWEPESCGEWEAEPKITLATFVEAATAPPPPPPPVSYTYRQRDSPAGEERFINVVERLVKKYPNGTFIRRSLDACVSEALDDLGVAASRPCTDSDLPHATDGVPTDGGSYILDRLPSEVWGEILGFCTGRSLLAIGGTCEWLRAQAEVHGCFDRMGVHAMCRNVNSGPNFTVAVRLTRTVNPIAGVFPWAPFHALRHRMLSELRANCAARLHYISVQCESHRASVPSWMPIEDDRDYVELQGARATAGVIIAALDERLKVASSQAWCRLWLLDHDERPDSSDDVLRTFARAMANHSAGMHSVALKQLEALSFSAISASDFLQRSVPIAPKTQRQLAALISEVRLASLDSHEKLEVDVIDGIIGEGPRALHSLASKPRDFGPADEGAAALQRWRQLRHAHHQILRRVAAEPLGR